VFLCVSFVFLRGKKYFTTKGSKVLTKYHKE
jgi:hypothetical protein